MKGFVVLLICISLVSLVSCESMPQGVEEHKGAAGGAAAGAAGGAIIGGLAGGGKGAVIGGLLGALAGGAVGHYAYDQKRSQAQTNQAYAYNDPNASVRIESASVKPTTVTRGGREDLAFSYAVLTTSQEPVSVKETREIWYGNTLWSSPETTVERTGGTFESSVPIFIPNDAGAGKFKVRFIVQVGNTKDVRESSFTVK